MFNYEKMKLIYHTQNDLRQVSKFDESLLKVATNAPLLRLASPYIGLSYLTRLIELSLDWVLLSDIEAWLESGNSKHRAECWSFILQNLSKIRHIPHAVELWLKMTIQHYQNIFFQKNNTVFNFDFKKSHDIGVIWALIKSESKSIDIRFDQLISKLDSFVCDISNIDPSGQTFRYPFDVDSKKHLVDIDLINILLLKKALSEMETLFDQLNFLGIRLEEEYSLGTFTKKLSRVELFNLAKKLPAKEEWAKDKFNAIKEQLKTEFHLSSNGLSKAIDLIKENYETASIIRAPLDLKDLGPNTLNAFLTRWFELYDKETILKIPQVDISVVGYGSHSYFESMVNWGEKKEELVNQLMEELNFNEVIGLTSLCRFDDFNLYSEKYIHVHSGLTQNEVNSESNKKRLIHNILEKTNSFEYILNSLYLMGHRNKIEQLIGEFNDYELSDAPWVKEILEGTKVKKHDLLSYPNPAY